MKASIRRVFQSGWVPFERIDREDFFFFKGEGTATVAIWMTGL